jgi:hypothetical protein
MNIQTIAEHSVDLDLLGPGSKILDIGCLGFVFTHHMLALGHEVYAVDIQQFLGKDYYQLAITNYNGEAKVFTSSDKQAARIDRRHKAPAEYSVVAMTLPTFSKSVDVEFWDLIKIDIEGSEYQVVMSLDKAPATQISIEMHLHTGIYQESEVNDMVNKLYSLGYDSVKHNKYQAHGCGDNYWDSLFILKDRL